MNRVASIAWVLFALPACGRSYAGTAAGRCTVRHASPAGGEVAANTERTDPVEIRLEDEADARLRVRMRDCDLHARLQSPEMYAHPHFAITRGHCRWDVPPGGPAGFDLAARSADLTASDAPGGDGFVNVTPEGEVLIGFEAAVGRGLVSFACDARRR